MRSNAGGAKKRPTRYGGATSAALSQAMRLHKKGDVDAAVTAYRRVLALDAQSLDALMNLGALEAACGRASAARVLLDAAQLVAPGDARVARDIGIARMAIGELGGARDALERAILLDAELVGARLHASRVCAELGDERAALDHANAAAVLAPEDASSHLELHRASFIDTALEPAIAAAERATELAPNHALAHYFRAAAIALARGDRSALAHPVIPPALADAASYALERGAGGRFFATRRQTLRFASQQATLLGAVVELGVRFGVSTRVLAGELDHVHAFDSFEGLPEPWQGKPKGTFSTHGEVPALPDNVTVHRGWFEHTLPPFTRDLSAPLRLLHIDSDLYTSAATGLRELGAHVRSGTIIVFDQYLGNESWRDDEHRAFQEAVALFGWRCRALAFSWVTGQAVIRVE